MEQCPSCGKKFAKYPLKNEYGKFIWKNLFKMDLVSILFLLAILFMTYGYIHDTQACREVYEAPMDFCEDRVGCYCASNQKEESEPFWMENINVSSVAK